MSLSPGAATIISLALSILLLAITATGIIAYAPNGATATGLLAGGPVCQDDSASPPSKIAVIDESANGSAVRVARGDTLLVQLPERETYKTWQFDGGSAFKVVSDTVLEMYPARHDFRVKVLGPGELRFTKVDSRDGMTIDTFSVTVTLKKGTPEKDSPGAYPMWHVDAIYSGIMSSIIR